MALSKCRSCNKEIADTAKQCPHCGDQYPHGAAVAMGQAAAPMIGMILGVVILLLFLTKGCN